MAVSQATPEAATPMAEQQAQSAFILDQDARSGNLTLVERDDRKNPRVQPIREVEVNGCYVAFKTVTDGVSFRGSIVHLGKGSSIRSDQQGSRIRIISAPANAGVTLLRSTASNGEIVLALQQVQDACQAEDVIF
ncbi:hypothetical protein [Sphingobium yanoikuyae]|nr:hypothetical protein [Sphingobium yanoikuyae]